MLIRHFAIQGLSSLSTLTLDETRGTAIVVGPRHDVDFAHVDVGE